MASIDKIRRILTLVERLQCGRLYNAKELADFCGVSHRTMFRDLKVLQQSGVAVVYDEQRRGYHMPAATFLPPTDLTLDEALALLVLTHELGQAGNGVPFLDAARAGALKFLSNLRGPLRTHLGELTSAIHARVEPHHPLADARVHFERVQEALTRRTKLRLEYHSLFENKDINTLVSPYTLLYSRRSWYLIGRSSLHRSVRTFHLGRINSSTPTDDAYTIPPRFSLSRHLGLAWHLIREVGQRREVVVKFQPLVATNVAEVAWHPTQRITRLADGSIEFRVTTDGLKEISWWILGYGDQAEVLEPPELRQMIAERVAGMSRIYAEKAAATLHSRESRTAKRRDNPAR
jgi:predicted DNA-binding transcriptional regulator YafY